MMRKRNIVGIFASSTVVLLYLLSIIGCSFGERIVIDGETAAMLEDQVNGQIFDAELSDHGNTASNIRNGGYLLHSDDVLWFINEMDFAADVKIGYLQRLPVTLVGNPIVQNDIVAELSGTLVGMHGKFILFLASGSNLLFSFDTSEFVESEVFNETVDAGFLVDDTLYLSTEASGDLWSLALDTDVANRLVITPSLLAEDAGKLVGVSHGVAFLADDDGTTITEFDVESGAPMGALTGANYHDVQISGSWVFFLDGNSLMRQSLVEDGPVVQASVKEIVEYAILDDHLVFTSESGGLFISELDGSGITRLSFDIAEGIQLWNNQIYYRNGYDDDRIYVIDLVEKTRSALIGPTMTDGGIHFTELSEAESSIYEAGFGDTIRLLAEQIPTGGRLPGNLEKGSFLFAELKESDPAIIFHTLSDVPLVPDEVRYLVLISYQPTVLGRYTDGDLAYRTDTILTLFDLNSTLKPLYSTMVAGQPPIEIKIGAGDRYGLPLSWHAKALGLIEAVNGN